VDRARIGPGARTEAEVTDEGFLGRWSRRKGAAKRMGEAASGTAAVDARVDEPDDDAAAPPRPRRGVMNTEPRDPTIGELAESAAPPDDVAAADPTADLPPVEQLDEASDYTAFMRDGVPEELKSAALRKLWRANPVFALRDGLDDYDEDFAALAAVAERLQKIRQVGRLAADRDREEAPEAKPEVSAAAEAAAPPPDAADSAPESPPDGVDGTAEEAVETAATEDESEAPTGRAGGS